MSSNLRLVLCKTAFAHKVEKLNYSLSTSFGNFNHVIQSGPRLAQNHNLCKPRSDLAFGVGVGVGIDADADVGHLR